MYMQIILSFRRLHIHNIDTFKVSIDNGMRLDLQLKGPIHGHDIYIDN